MTHKDIGNLKSDIISLLMNDSDIVDALIGPVDEDADVEYLLTSTSSGSTGHIHKYEYVPEINETADTFLNVEAVVAKRPESATTYDIFVHVFIFCHKSVMETYHREGMAGTRVDILDADVCRILDGNPNLGIGSMRVLTDEIYKPVVNYYGRVVTYSVNEFSRNRSLHK